MTTILNLLNLELWSYFLSRVTKDSMKVDKNIHKYFHLGDIVINYDIWDKRLFVIRGFGGNCYLPELYVYGYGKPKIIRNFCNWSVRDTTLIDSPNRPFKKLKKIQLLKLLKTGSERIKEDIKREIIIRTNKRIYGII